MLHILNKIKKNEKILLSVTLQTLKLHTNFYSLK